MPMRAPIRVRLSVMMFLQFCVWGSWYVTLSTYLSAIHFSDVSIGGIYSTVNWGAILAPVIAGMLADRFFPAQIVMGVLHLLGAALRCADLNRCLDRLRRGGRAPGGH